VKVQDGDPFAGAACSCAWRAWCDGVARLNDALTCAEALGTGEKLQLTIAQLPYSDNGRWVGLPLKPGQSLPGGKLSLAVQSTAPVDVRRPLAGMLIDEWVEVVPNASESPASPCNTINPMPPRRNDSDCRATGGRCAVDGLVAATGAAETLDLARIRAVDPDALDEVGHYLPALYFGV